MPSDAADRLTDTKGRILMVPMDHGISMGPVVDPVQVLETIADRATCTTVHKGLLGHCLRFDDKLTVLMHLSASTDLAPDPNDKRLVGTVQEALQRGATGVSTHLNLGSVTEADQLEAIGRVGADCAMAGAPHIAMVYPRGPTVRDPFDPALVAHAARLGVELGADVVKVPFTGDEESFRPVVEGALGVPVIVAGGPRTSDFESWMAALGEAHDAGASGVSIGRNIFQADDPAEVMDRIAEVFG